ncbi:MAG TPA: hypothetical protein PLU94_07885 [Methanoregulaceae archaeon]|nr:hypothetical protein [Methanoregulaceae archaeon]
MYAIRFYRIYDIGEEIDLGDLEKALASSMAIARTGFVRVRPTSMTIEEPPLLLRLQPAYAETGGAGCTFTVVSRVFDFGAVSICLILEEMNAPASALQDAADRFSGNGVLDPHFSAALQQVRAILAPNVGDRSIDEDFYDDYTIYLSERLDESIDPVALLLGEKEDFSPEIRQETLQNQLSYARDDRAILSWNGAILISPQPPSDLIELIEFAAVQVLELRFYDRELSRQMEKMYDDIEVADRLFWYSKVRQYHSLMKVLMRTQTEVSEIVEKVNNLIKITEDVYYARVYAMALKVLRSQQWTESLNRRIGIIRENYRMLSDEVDVQHSNFLEWVVIILIAFEVALFLPSALH